MAEVIDLSSQHLAHADFQKAADDFGPVECYSLINLIDCMSNQDYLRTIRDLCERRLGELPAQTQCAVCGAWDGHFLDCAAWPKVSL